MTDALSYISRFTMEDPSNMFSQQEQIRNLLLNEGIVQDLSRTNMVLKGKIDNFRRLHQKRMNEIKERLGIEASA